MEKNILILCCGYPYSDTGFGFHVSKVLEKMSLPENVEVMEVGESASMMPSVIDGMNKLIVVDVFFINDKPGTVVRYKMEEVPITVNRVTDVPKLHLVETLEQIKLIGKCPDTIFIGVVPKDVANLTQQLTPEVESKIPVVIDLIMKEIKNA